MDNNICLSFASSLTDICELNSSFDTGVLRICYTGLNRNKSFFSKEDLERSLDTIYNCPVVVNYNIEEDKFGGHDMAIVKNQEGEVKLINVTEPVGMIPESSRVWFDEYEDENGVSHEYLYADVLLWKRQAAYEKIKRDGVTNHSMEVSVKNGEIIDGVYHIHDFEFTAFALLGDDVTPCFESSALEMYTAKKFKATMSEMMQELKDVCNGFSVHKGCCDNKSFTEGGEEALNEKMELIQKFGFAAENLEFSIEDLTIDELTQKLVSMKDVENVKFELSQNIVEEIKNALNAVKVTREWGEYCRYCYVDYDSERGEVYCWDTEDWLLYGFKYSLDGDRAVIDFESKKRKKHAIVDFDEGEDQPSAIMEVFSIITDEFHQANEDKNNFERRLNDETTKFEKIESELTELRNFKANLDAENAKAEREAVFAKFTELNGVEEFESLRANCEEMSTPNIEEKCFAIRGRHCFTLEPEKGAATVQTPKTLVDRSGVDNAANEPYNGIFVKYGY